MGFLEKAASGVAFLVLQNNSPISLSPCEINCDYFKYVVACSCGGFSLFGLAIIAILYPMVINPPQNIIKKVLKMLTPISLLPF